MTPTEIAIVIAAVVITLIIVIALVMYARSRPSPIPRAPGYTPVTPDVVTTQPPVWADPNPTSPLPPPIPISGAPAVYVPPPPPAKTVPSQTPTLYRAGRFESDAWQVPGLGKYNITNPRVRNEASSIRIPQGWKLTAYDFDGCTGRATVYYHDVDELSGTKDNNDIECVHLELA